MGWGASVLASSSDKSVRGSKMNFLNEKNVVFCNAQILNHWPKEKEIK
jgi:hypothetical protein